MKMPSAIMTILCFGLLTTVSLDTFASDPVPAKLGQQPAIQQLQLRTLDDQPLAICSANQPALTVFIFISRTCPIANAYQPRLRELQQTFESKDVRFVQVYVARDITIEEARAHVREFDIKSAMVIDADRKLANALEARVTPEAVIVDRHGKVQYRGRIDDQFAALGKKRPQPTRHDLQVALQECLAGEAVTVPVTQAIGCSISK